MSGSFLPEPHQPAVKMHVNDWLPGMTVVSSRSGSLQERNGYYGSENLSAIRMG